MCALVGGFDNVKQIMDRQGWLESVSYRFTVDCHGPCLTSMSPADAKPSPVIFSSVVIFFSLPRVTILHSRYGALFVHFLWRC